MRRTVAALGLVMLVVALVPAGASARAVIGMGDQKPAMFGDQRFGWLGIRHARLVVSWDVQRTPYERRWAANWLQQAREQGVEPLVAFGHSWTPAGRRRLPSVKAYRSAFLRFRSAYPWVRTYTAWNEANHCSQPTCHRPERAAAYYDVIRSACPHCTVAAADVLDQPNMAAWLRRFRRAAKHRPRLWGLHNYLDANRLRSEGTRHLLRLVPGDVWITETGGVVRRNHYRSKISFPESAEHAAKVTTFILALADGEPRITRVYLYQWNADSLFQSWDSGLIDPFGQHRPSFDIVARRLGRDPAHAPGAQPFAVTPVEPPVPAGPGADQQPAPPPQPPQDQSPPPPSDGGSGSGGGGSGSGGGSGGGGSPPPPPPPTCPLAPLPCLPTAGRVG